MLLTKTGLAASLAFLAGSVVCAAEPAPPWRTVLDEQMPLLGHRNWIAVIDSAYPWQVSPGVTTVYTAEDQIDVLRVVLDKVKAAPHVRGEIFLDSELPFVMEEAAPGIETYRRQLEEVLKGEAIIPQPHEKTIEMLDEAGQTFRVLLLKTDLTLPYTSVFIRLDCGYWSGDAEAAMRTAIEQAQ